jgi:uncharacterized protein
VILREPAEALDPRVRRYWTARGLLATAVAAALTTAVTAVVAVGGATTTAVLVAVAGALVVGCLFVVAVLTPRYEYKHYRYEVTELGLYVARGWLWRRWQIVPHARVQTVDTSAGPLMRALGLVALEVTTASAAGGTSIPGLRPAVADALLEELARRAGIEEGT